jgi:GAF domain-containing protein
MLGCLEVHNKARGGTFDVQDIIILQGLAASGAVAIEDMRLHVIGEGLADEVVF